MEIEMVRSEMIAQSKPAKITAKDYYASGKVCLLLDGVEKSL